MIKIQAPSQNNQGETLDKVIDRVLNQILGQEATQVIYHYLEKNYFIQRHEIAEKLDSFNQALENCLGSGALVIEKVILENSELGGLKEIRNLDLAERQRLIKLA